MRWVAALAALLCTAVASASPGRMPMTGGPHALAYVLLASIHLDRDPLLLNSLALLRDNVLPSTPGDVLLFHTGEYADGERLAAVKRVLPAIRPIRIPERAWQLPAGVTESHFRKGFHSTGYRHMCRWYSSGLFRVVYNLGYRWVLRLDDDSAITAKVTHNLVAWMEAHGKQYGMRSWAFDGEDVTWSLPELTAWYITSREINPKWLYRDYKPPNIHGLNSRGGWNRRIIYNNFFMANVTWWLQPQIQDYLNVLQASQGMYLFRWGDAPIHTMVTGMFLDEKQMHQFQFPYCHRGCIEGTVGGPAP